MPCEGHGGGNMKENIYVCTESFCHAVEIGTAL